MPEKTKIPRPRGNRVLLRLVTGETTSRGGIVVPDVGQKKHRHAVVAAVGEGKHLDNGEVRPISLRPGENVICSAYEGTDISIDSVPHTILDADSVLCLVE